MKKLLAKLINEWGLELVLKELVEFVKGRGDEPAFIRLAEDLQKALDNYKAREKKKKLGA